MANKDLQKKTFSLPEEILSSLRKVFEKYNSHKDSSGYKRLKNILLTKEIGYAQMKRIKNYFDTYNGNETDVEYFLNGGNILKNWVNDQLRGERDKIDHEKEVRKNNGEINQYRKPHSKNNKTISRDYLLDKLVYESEIERIKQLIKNIK